MVHLAAAHLDHDPWNPYPRLAALCPACHARYDYSWQQRQRWGALEQLRHMLLLQRRHHEEGGNGWQRG
jgi:hypothetical protein